MSDVNKIVQIFNAQRRSWQMRKSAYRESAPFYLHEQRFAINWQVKRTQKYRLIMGICCGASAKNMPNQANWQSRYQFICALALGSISQVFLVRDRDTEKSYAMKIIKKTDILAKEMVYHAIREQHIIRKSCSGFLLKLVQSFQDRKQLYLITPFMPYQDLQCQITSKGYFNEHEAKFVVSCLTFGLKQLRKLKVVHLGIRPQNILIDEDCYFTLGGFSSSADIDSPIDLPKRVDKSGEPFLAPEICRWTAYSYSADYYSLGILLNLMVLGSFKTLRGSDRITRNIQVTDDCLNFIEQLTISQPKNRLGVKSFDQIWNHPWLKMNDQAQKDFRIKDKRKSPFIAVKMMKDDRKQTKMKEHMRPDVSSTLLLSDNKFQSIFDEYDCVGQK